MTQEEKAKRYDEALHKAKNYYSTTDSSSDIKLIGLIFPELKESDDEKIRKALVEMVHDTTGDSLWVDYNVHKEDAIDWLEKQGEHANFRNKIQIGDKVTRNEDGVLVNLSQLNRVAKKDKKQGEQKPAWSKEDEARFESCIEVLQTSDGYDTINAKWLKSLKERYTWKPSDEQMLALDSAIHCYAGISPTNNREVYALEIMKEQLKKLRGE